MAGLEKRRLGYGHFYSGDLKSAAEALSDSTDSRNRFLYALDRGVIAHTDGRVEESNRAFARAEEYAEELRTTDVSDVAVSFLVNDYAIEYKGEDFEKVLIHPFKALNYLALGEPQEALVECRALNNRLVEINEKYEQSNVYNEDAFARYLSGIIYESEGNLNDALVDYRLAATAFLKYEDSYGTPFPASLRSSLLRASEAQGREGLHDEYGKRWPEVTWIPYREMREMGEVVLVLENGQAPVKEENRFDLMTEDEIFSFAFPSYRALPVAVAYGTVRTRGRSAPTELVEDVAAIAIKDLKDRYHRVVAKELVRLAAKHASVEAMKEKNTILGYILNFVNSANEHADLRSWETLPANFQIARLPVEPGHYPNIYLELYGWSDERIDTIDLGAWDIQPGKTVFIYHRTLK